MIYLVKKCDLSWFTSLKVWFIMIYLFKSVIYHDLPL